MEINLRLSAADIFCSAISSRCISLSASLYSLLLTKFLLSVLFIFVIMGVLSEFSVAYRGSGRSPINRRMVIQRALAANWSAGSGRSRSECLIGFLEY